MQIPPGIRFYNNNWEYTSGGTTNGNVKWEKFSSNIPEIFYSESNFNQPGIYIDKNGGCKYYSSETPISGIQLGTPIVDRIIKAGSDINETVPNVSAVIEYVDKNIQDEVIYTQTATFPTSGQISGSIYINKSGETRLYAGSKWQKLSLPVADKITAETSDYVPTVKAVTSYIDELNTISSYVTLTIPKLEDGDLAMLTLYPLTSNGFGLIEWADIIGNSQIFDFDSGYTSVPAGGITSKYSNSIIKLPKSLFQSNKIIKFSWNINDLNEYGVFDLSN